jgi:hypothetical protein
MIISSKSSREFCLILFVISSILILSCASKVNPDPYKKFANSAIEAQEGIDQAMSVTFDWTKAGFIEGFSSNPESKFSELLIEPGSGFEWTWVRGEPPIYVDVANARGALYNLNTAFVGYANLLAKLAGNEIISVDTFDQMAKDMNSNVRDGAKALYLNVPAEGIAIFSLAAIEAFKLYIENKRQEYLINGITDNQQNIEDLSVLVISLINTMRISIAGYYESRYEPIRVAWNSSTGEKRQKQTEKMLNLNQQYSDTIRTLQELEKTYAAFPKANADLAKAIENPGLSVDGIQELYSSAKRLHRLYKELKKEEE